MEITEQHVNKRAFLIFILLLIINYSTIAQEKVAVSTFIRSLEKKFRIPNSLRDSCLYEATMLRVSLDKHSKSIVIGFSDNAATEIKKELEIIKDKLDINALRKNRAVKCLKNVDMIFPVFFIGCQESYEGKYKIERKEQTYSTFNGDAINKPVLLQEPIVLIHYVKLH